MERPGLCGMNVKEIAKAGWQAGTNGNCDAIHNMQLLLNIVEDHGTQLQMKFGKDKFLSALS
jgi:hypothetical protein